MYPKRNKILLGYNEIVLSRRNFLAFCINCVDKVIQEEKENEIISGKSLWTINKSTYVSNFMVPTIQILINNIES